MANSRKEGGNQSKIKLVRDYTDADIQEFSEITGGRLSLDDASILIRQRNGVERFSLGATAVTRRRLVVFVERPELVIENEAVRIRTATISRRGINFAEKMLPIHGNIKISHDVMAAARLADTAAMQRSSYNTGGNLFVG